MLLQVGSADAAESQAESRKAADILGVPLLVTPGVSHASSVWQRELGMALPFALDHLVDQWPVRRAPPADAVTLGAPAALPERGVARVGSPPDELWPPLAG